MEILKLGVASTTEIETSPRFCSKNNKSSEGGIGKFFDKNSKLITILSILNTFEIYFALVDMVTIQKIGGSLKMYMNIDYSNLKFYIKYQYYFRA